MTSIIIPVFQAEKYLGKCVESIIAQTYSDWELWLVDDGSTDGSASLCDSFAAKDTRIKVLHQTNGGPAAARNNALRQCKGDTVYFADSDDWLEPDMLEVMHSLMNESGADIVTVEYFEERDNQTVVRGFNDGHTCEYSRDEALLMILRDKLPSYLWTKLFRKDVLVDEIPNLRAFEDHAVFFKWASRAKKILSVNKALYHYRMNPDSILHRPDISLNTCLFKAIDMRRNHIRKLGLLKGHDEWVKDIYVKNIIKITKDIARSKASFEEREKLISDVYENIRREKINHSSLNSKQNMRLWLMKHNMALYIKLMNYSAAFVKRR